jgi:dTMP kinase
MGNTRGLYIVIEGLDGAGKTTQHELLKAALTAKGHDVIDVFEPGGTPIGNAVRQVLKDGSLERTPESNFDLFTACRRELLVQVMLPALRAGKIVLSDRNWFTSVTIQSFGEGLSRNLIIERSKEVMGDHFMPDVPLILDISGAKAYERLQSRGGQKADYFEKQGAAFLEKHHQGYLWIATEFDVPLIDATQDRETIHAQIMDYVDKAL